MTQSLSGKTALVTGASRGIGRAIALKLAREGCAVCGTYFNGHEEAATLETELRELGVEAQTLQLNVAIPESITETFAALAPAFERLDVLVSNAASGVLQPALEMSRKHWRWCLETNALALDLLVQAALPRMGRGGRVVALSSLGASRAIPNYAFVGASKAALESLVRSLALELGPRGITVNAVSGGVVDTHALAHFPNRAELLAEYARRTPAGPELTPEDLAGAVYLLCRPEAAMITGQTLVADGGYSITG